MTKESIYVLARLKRKYLALRSGEIAMLALAGCGVIFGVASILDIGMTFRVTLSVVTGAVIFATAFFLMKLNRFNNNRLIAFINEQYPVMQYSTDLLLKDRAGLTSLQQIQKERIGRHFEEVVRTITFPHHIGRAAIALSVSIVLAFLMASFSHEEQRVFQKDSGRVSGQEKNSEMPLPASVDKIAIKVDPPNYTGLAAYSTEDLNLSIPEGSVVAWEITFTDTVQNPQLQLLPGDSVNLTGAGIKYNAGRSFKASTIYQFSWTTASGKRTSSDYYKIQIVPDQPPRIAVLQLPEYTQVSPTDRQSVELKAMLSDDYGLRDAYIIATVSKGSGESVKFREEKFLFTSPANIRGRRTPARRIIDLAGLGLEPGDELYFYIEAHDNKTPAANWSRSETFFIALLDTASQTLSIDAGPGIDLMPAYFRSQRQIITDTEKLLRERKVIRRQEFNSKSNTLGYDQKMLRLKYGEFLGEEFEQTIGPNGLQHESYDHHEGEEADPIAAYTHVHDDPEEATFFTQSIKSKLKAALAAMWDAELHLRTLHPETSLPYQFTALRLLKDISQASRIYVHKTGFDPPPLKEERRLSGDLSEIKSSREYISVEPEQRYPAIRSALNALEKTLNYSDSSLTPTAKQTLLHAGRELAALAIEEPGNYLTALSLIKSLNEDTVPPEEIGNSLLTLRKVFWRILPEEMVSPDKPTQSAHSLNDVFIQNLEPLKNE